MSKILISNPFLFPPIGDDDETTKELFKTRATIVKDYILFSLNNFEKAWETESSERNPNLDLNLFPAPLVSSPTLSTASTEIDPLNIAMEEELFTFDENFDFASYQFSPISLNGDIEKANASLKEKEFSDDPKKELLYTTDQALNQMESIEHTMFPVTVQNDFSDKIFKPIEANMKSVSNPLIQGESIDFGDLLSITANDPDPPAQLIIPDHVQQEVTLQPVSVKVEAENTFSTTPFLTERPIRQRRKSNPVNRNVEFSPATFEQNEGESIHLQCVEVTPEMKPTTTALANLNGTEGRTRNLSVSSSTSTMMSPSPMKPRSSKDGESKRKRKYEIDDPSDPSVKNAKAAKMNRDKKKQQMQELQRKVNDLTAHSQQKDKDHDEYRRNAEDLQQQYKQEIERLGNLLQEERAKNSSNSRQKVAMFDLIQKIASVVTPAPSVICVTERLAAIPMPDLMEMERIRAMPQTSSPPVNGTDTYLTFKDPNIDRHGH